MTTNFFSSKQQIKNMLQHETYSNFEKYFKNIDKPEFVVLGDNIQDVYEYVSVNGVANKSAHISATINENDSSTIVQFGGAKVIAAHLVEGCCPIFCDFKENFVIKKRYINKDNNQKLFETHKMNYNISFMTNPDSYSNVDNCIIADFGHYYFNDDDPEIIITPFLKKNLYLMVQTNSSNYGMNTFHKWKFLTQLNAKIKCISLDLKEAQLYIGTPAEIDHILDRFTTDFNSEYVILTRGKDGLSVLKQRSNINLSSTINFPAISTEVIDTMGCGDAAFAIGSYMISQDAPHIFIGFAATLAGWMHSQVLGNTQFIEKQKFLEYAKTFFIK